MQRTVLITGAAGGIGAALVNAYAEEGWRVIATDKDSFDSPAAHSVIPADLEKIASDDDLLKSFAESVRATLDGSPLHALVNNAAAQILGSVEAITTEAWERTLSVNVSAPLRLVQALLPELQTASGVVVNVGSVHAQATKKGFVAYATSKAAIHGLTRAMAVDLGSNPRVICVAPAAVGTAMLHDGFSENTEAIAELASAHPVGRIADPSEIAKSIVRLSQEPFLFITGSTIWLDGGILSRLHDPA